MDYYMSQFVNHIPRKLKLGFGVCEDWRQTIVFCVAQLMF